MTTALWIAQALLAMVFLGSGICKATFSRQKLIDTKQTGVVDLPMPLVRFIGVMEVIGAAGLILPGLTHIVPVLIAFSAIGLGIIMKLAAVVHYRLHEPKNVVSNLILLGLCLFVVCGNLFLQ